MDGRGAASTAERPGGELAFLRGRVEELSSLTRELQQALDSRTVIEQAKGILAERFGLSVNEAFSLLRGAARGARMNLHLLSLDVVEEAATPQPVTAWMASHDWTAPER